LFADQRIVCWRENSFAVRFAQRHLARFDGGYLAWNKLVACGPVATSDL
jgi:hypothetical protein